jgi:hypothetical protein
LWVEEQLTRIRDFLTAHGADGDMLYAVETVREDNARWIDPEIVKDLRAPDAVQRLLARVVLGGPHSGEA